MIKSQTTVEQVFHALGDATRRRIMERLTEGPASASQLAEPFELSLAAVVQHLQILEECRLVRSEKAGRVRTCALCPEGLQAAANWIGERLAVTEFDSAEEVPVEAEMESYVNAEPEWLG